jgi:hypothetical protein
MGRSYRARITGTAASRVRGIVEFVELSLGRSLKYRPGVFLGLGRCLTGHGAGHGHQES